MTLNDLEWLFHDKMHFQPAVLESERLNVSNSTKAYNLCDSAVFCAMCALHDQLVSLGRHAHCAADALFLCGSWASCQL